MAALISHIPDRGAQTTRYLGHYSNAAGGRSKKEDSQTEYHIIEDNCSMQPSLHPISGYVDWVGDYRLKREKEILISYDRIK